MPRISRRRFIHMGGAALSAAGLSSVESLFSKTAEADAAIRSMSENLFWSEIMLDHAVFLTALLPGEEHRLERAHAEEFGRQFRDRLAALKSQKLNEGNYAAANQTTIELLKPFISYKKQLLAAQNAGLIHSLAWPLFFDHTAREAERAVFRLERLSAGDLKVEYSDTVDFWAGIMSDHGEFVGRLLDPAEKELSGQALDSSAVFQGFRMANRAQSLREVDILVATEEMVDFKTVIARGIDSGAIRSMISPRFADHMRREALYFVDELRRSSGRT